MLRNGVVLRNGVDDVFGFPVAERQGYVWKCARPTKELAMNTKLLYRLAWKEVRTLRALWWTLIITAIVLQFGLVWFFDPWFTDRYPRKDWLFGVALTLPVIYAWACSALSFAVEKEEGTDQFMSRMAAPPLSLLGVKLGVCVASTLTMFGVLYFLVLFVAALVIPEIWQRLVPELEHIPQWRLEAFAWAVDFWSFGTFFSLVFRRVLPCLFATVLATTALPWVPSALCGVEGSSERFGWLVRLGIAPAFLLLASVWLVQTWDENRWPRLIERLLEAWRRVTAKSERLTDSSREAGQLSGGWRVLARPFGLCLSDEWLPSWRRETRRLLWLEWRSAWKVSLGLVVAGSGVLIALVLSSGSQTDLRFVMSILPLVLAMVVFVLGVWSFHGEQREQRFRFYATHGASPIAMWAVKHVVWLSCAIVAVVVLLCVSTLVSERAIFEKEIMEGGMRNVVEAARDRRMGWSETNPAEPLNRFVFCLSNATKTSLDVVVDPKDLPSSWPLVSLVVLSIGRGFVAVWLCFTLGQLVSLLIPRAVTSILVGLIVLGVTVAWWFVISIYRVPLAIAVLPVLAGLLVAAWGRMSDWLEERSDWGRWLRLAVTVLVPMFLAVAGMATFRVYEVPYVALPW